MFSLKRTTSFPVRQMTVLVDRKPSHTDIATCWTPRHDAQPGLMEPMSTVCRIYKAGHDHGNREFVAHVHGDDNAEVGQFLIDQLIFHWVTSGITINGAASILEYEEGVTVDVEGDWWKGQGRVTITAK